MPDDGGDGPRSDGPVRGMHAGRSFRELIALDQLEATRFRAEYTFPDPYSTYGGQVSAQALAAVCRTVPEGRVPHSMHGYFLRPGDPTVPTDLVVAIERDGRNFSVRRVEAQQRGRAYFVMLCSLSDVGPGAAAQVVSMPPVSAPADSPDWPIPRIFSFEARSTEQDHGNNLMRSRYWARCCEDLGADPVLNLCALTYLTDITNPLGQFDSDSLSTGPSLDYGMWFHSPINVNDWVLVDLRPRVMAAGRGMYDGSIYDIEGRLLASLTQETLIMERPPNYFPHGI